MWEHPWGCSRPLGCIPFLNNFWCVGTASRTQPASYKPREAKNVCKGRRWRKLPPSPHLFLVMRKHPKTRGGKIQADLNARKKAELIIKQQRYGRLSEDELKLAAAKLRKHRAACSCHMCRNPRTSKVIKGKERITLQEHRNNQTFKESNENNN